MNSAVAGAVLASVAAGGLAYVFVYPLLSGDARAEKRQKALVESGPERRIDRVSTVVSVLFWTMMSPSLSTRP